MPKLRLLPPQFLIPAWPIQQCRQIRPLHSKPESQPRLKPTPPKPAGDSPRSTPSTPHLSLLEELFPEEAAKLRATSHSPAATKGPDRHAAPLPLSPDLDDVSSAYGRPHHKGSGGLPRRRDGRIGTLSEEARRRTETTVMVIRNASKSLCEDDFRRVVPKGKHIEGWKGQGDILKVIPLRDPLTLHPTGSYLLSFPSLLFAKSYQEQLIYLHRMARTHTPTSIESPLPPPPGYKLADGEDVYQLLQEYALIPPSQRLWLRLLMEPYSPMIKGLLEKGGYDGIVEDQGRSPKPNMGTSKPTGMTTATEPNGTEQPKPAAVLFWVEGIQPSTFSLKQLIARDGRDRGLPWSVSVGPSPTSPGSPASRSNAFTTATTPLAITKLAAPPPATPTPIYPEHESGNEDDDHDEDQTQVSTRRVSRWIIRFDNETEARRFVRAWNRRVWPMSGRDGGVAHGDEAPIVGAEILW